MLVNLISLEDLETLTKVELSAGYTKTHLLPSKILPFKSKTITKKRELKPSLFLKILCINNFTTKLLSKLLSDLYIGVHLKGTKKFGSKVINRQLSRSIGY